MLSIITLQVLQTSLILNCNPGRVPSTTFPLGAKSYLPDKPAVKLASFQLRWFPILAFSRTFKHRCGVRHHSPNTSPPLFACFVSGSASVFLGSKVFGSSPSEGSCQSLSISDLRGPLVHKWIRFPSLLLFYITLKAHQTDRKIVDKDRTFQCIISSTKPRLNLAHKITQGSRLDPLHTDAAAEVSREVFFLVLETR